MTLSRLLEQAIVADLDKDGRITEFPIQIHDNPGAKASDTPTGGEPAKIVTTVSVKEGQEVFGTGIKKMIVAVEIRASLAADPNAGTLLDSIESAVSSRLQPSYPVVGVTGREDAFSGPLHKVFGITADGVTRTESNLERVRVVNRTFIETLLPTVNTAPLQQNYLYGIGSLTPLNTTDFSTLYGWTNSNVLFYRGRFGWDFIQPTSATSYNWAPIDALAARCAQFGKKYSFNVAAGLTTPQWVYNAGAYKYGPVHDPSANNGYQPLPWDPVYQEIAFTFLDALAARYGNDPNFVNYVACFFMQEAGMYLGDATDEAAMPYSGYGYSSVHNAYIAGAEAILTHHMTALTSQKVVVTYVAPFPTDAGQADGQTVKNWLIDTFPTRGGIMVSSVFAQAGFGPAASPMRNGHGFPKGGQQYQATLTGGNVNPNVYVNPPVPLPDSPQPFLDMVGNAISKGDLYLETYQGDLQDSTIQAVLAACNANFLSIVPP